jgi:hypothetical protein
MGAHETSQQVLNPLPMEQRMVPEIIKPITTSLQLERLFAKFAAFREIERPPGQSYWEPQRITYKSGACGEAASWVSLCVIPEEDARFSYLSAPFRLGKVCECMAYIAMLEMPAIEFSALYPFDWFDRQYVSFYGKLPGKGYCLQFIDTSTRRRELKDKLARAQTLISAPVEGNDTPFDN